MKHFLALSFLSLALILSGCLVKPVSDSGGPGAVTVLNTNPSAIIAAATTIFPQYDYTPGPVNYPDSISFDKPAGKFGNIAYGSYGVSTTIRARMSIVQIPDTNNYRISVRPMVVSDAGEAGFESKRNMIGPWGGQFGPVLKQIQAQAANAGAF